MRASGNTAVASVKTSAAPPTARLPRCTRCQSVAKPSVLEYWHIGETMMRLRSRTSRICKLSKSTGQLPGANALGFRGKGRIARRTAGVKLSYMPNSRQARECAISHRGDEFSHDDDRPLVRADE